MVRIRTKRLQFPHDTTRHFSVIKTDRARTNLLNGLVTSPGDDDHIIRLSHTHRLLDCDVAIDAGLNMFQRREALADFINDFCR